MKKHYIVDSTFYMTNSCNLTCNNCETYNNKKFKGHYNWSNYYNDYQAWSKIVDLGIVNIHGGEPFTNPDLINWAIGLKELWPNANEYTVSTNGSLLKTKSTLVQEIIRLGWRLDVSVHDPISFNKIVNNVLKIGESAGLHLSTTEKNGEMVIRDTAEHKTIATILPQYYFIKNSAKYISRGKIFMHRNDINKAHKLCQERDDGPPCRWFVAGRLFKCHLTAISKELLNQFDVESEAVELLKKYKSASPYDSEDQINSFISRLYDPIAQCTLCPEKSTTFPIYPLSIKKDD